MKVWLASIAALLARRSRSCRRCGSTGELPVGATPAWIDGAHRISGRLAFLVSLPVAYHCLYQLAFQDSTTRVLAHSLLGCVFYGAFATKVMLIRTPGKPGLVTAAGRRRPVRGADRRRGSRAGCGSSPRTASRRPDVLRKRRPSPGADHVGRSRPSRVLVLLAGPSLIGAETDEAARGRRRRRRTVGRGALRLQLRRAATRSPAPRRSGSSGPNLDDRQAGRGDRGGGGSRAAGARCRPSRGPCARAGDRSRGGVRGRRGAGRRDARRPPPRLRRPPRSTSTSTGRGAGRHHRGRRPRLGHQLQRRDAPALRRRHGRTRPAIRSPSVASPTTRSSPGGVVWLALSGDDAVARVEDGNVTRIPVGDEPEDLAVAGGIVWVDRTPATAP